MSSREETKVKQILLTQKQMQETVRMATENAQTWAVWKDPHPPKKGNNTQTK